jgi:hypothetical protein
MALKEYMYQGPIGGEHIASEMLDRKVVVGSDLSRIWPEFSRNIHGWRYSSWIEFI